MFLNTIQFTVATVGGRLLFYFASKSNVTYSV